MADKKLQKALYGPSTTEVVLGAILGLLTGIAVACIYLVFKPVPMVKEMPKEPVRGTVYYLPGSDSRAKSKDWEAKLKQFQAGASIQVNEDELNAWIVAQKASAPAKPAAAPGAAATAPAVEGFVIPGQPNVRISGGIFQVGLPCTLNWYGVATDVTVQARGTFQKSGEHYVFVPQTIHLGSCPLHVLPVFGGRLLNHIVEKQKFSDDLRAAWAKLGEVSITGGSLSLKAP